MDRVGERSRGRVVRGSALALVWLALAGLLTVVLFLGSSRTLVLASHDTVVRPTLSGTITVHSGPVLPDLRLPSGQVVGVDLLLGKTQATSTEELVQRYAFIASHPEGQIARVQAAVRDMAWTAALRGAVLATALVGLWLLVGAERRRQLARGVPTRRGALALVGVAGLVVLLVQPWDHVDDPALPEPQWQPLADFAGVGSLPSELDDVEVRADITTIETRQLVDTALNTYRQSKAWYAAAVAAAQQLDLRRPEPGETVVLLVSDRHDNVGMDPVVRAVGDAAGASAIFSAGDDTSSGESWEAFSLDSLDEAFSDYDRYAVSGNHDHGTFVSDYLEQRGWTHLDGEVVEGPGGSVLAGADDPRSSGLGSWQDQPVLTLDEYADHLADLVCDADERVATLLVHDPRTGRPALERGCVDLVVGGHLHVQVGPTAITGENGAVGYTYTNGTTGGAVYSIAVGSKPRRAAEVTLITYRDGRPVGLQPVVLQTNGDFAPGAWVPLVY